MLSRKTMTEKTNRGIIYFGSDASQAIEKGCEWHIQRIILFPLTACVYKFLSQIQSVNRYRLAKEVS